MMESWFHQILHTVSTHPTLGIAFAFLISFTESLPIIGTIIPGSITMTAVGTLIGAHALPLYSTLLWASFGALCGDCIGYYLGKYCDTSIRQMWPFSKYPNWISKGEAFFHCHGGKSILIGRFIGPVRSTIPLIAGLLKLRTIRFFLAAIPSAICWALAYTLPGILLGRLSLDLSPKLATKFVLIGLVIIVFCWFIFWLAYRLGHRICSWLNNLVQQCWLTLTKRQSPAYKIIRCVRAPKDHHQLSLLILAILSLLCFSTLLLSVVKHIGLFELNTPIFHLLQSIRNPYLDHFFTACTLLGDKPVIFSFALLMMAWLCLQKQYRSAGYLLFAAFSSAAAIGFFKLMYHSPRPDSIMVVATSSSFPSGHTALVTVILGFCCYLNAPLAKPATKKIIYTLYILAIVLVALSRLYLGAHWFTDILGSFSLGFTVLFATILIYRRQLPHAKLTKPLPSTLLLALFIPWMTYGSWQFSSTLQNYTPKYTLITSTITQWWQHPGAQLPQYRNNRFGQPKLPFNVQWLSGFHQIKKTLLNHGWQMVKSSTNIKYNLNRFKFKEPNRHLPLAPLPFQGNTPQATFYKTTDHADTILELTLWPAPIKFIDNNTPLWIGTICYHRTTALKYIQYSRQNYRRD